MSETQLLIADHALNILHLVIVAVLVFGWIHPKTRTLHRWAVSITAFCWVAVAWVMDKKLGYCPVTDWQWQIKRLRGEKNIPSSYVDYLLQKFGLHFNPELIDLGALVVFGGIILITLFLWWSDRQNAALEKL